MNSKSILGLSLCLAAAVGLAVAQDSQPAEASSAPKAEHERSPLHPADLNNDGNVTAEEFSKFHEDLFAQADTSGDGQLDREEVMAMPKHMRGREGQIPPAPRPEWRSGKRGEARHGHRNPEDIFSTMDANDDGKLEPHEVPEGMAQHFERIDGDSDGALTLQELKQARPDREAMKARFEERITSMDKNGDGKIQKEEATGRMSERFDNMDANGDGAIDREEIDAMMARFGRHGRGGTDDHQGRHRPEGEAPAPAAATEPGNSPEA